VYHFTELTLTESKADDTHTINAPTLPLHTYRRLLTTSYFRRQ